MIDTEYRISHIRGQVMGEGGGIASPNLLTLHMIDFPPLVNVHVGNCRYILIVCVAVL